MSDSFNVPLPPRRPDPPEAGRPWKPDSVEWWTPRPAPPPETERPEAVYAPRIGRPNYLLHGALFVLTCLTTTFMHGLFYAAAIMSILLAHEMGHYLVARRYGVPATLPYFIPFPSFFGTMGAVIRLASLGADRKILFDIGVAGPIAGLVFAIPATIYGISLSEVVPTAPLHDGVIKLGSPLLFNWIADWIKGPLPPDYDINLHPIALAGWAGFFVTALNLLPVGQLDGGHAAYALLGRRGAGILSYITMVGFLGLAIFAAREWILMALLLLLFSSRLRHPPTGDDETPMDLPRKIVGAFMLLLFILMFTPRPFSN